MKTYRRLKDFSTWHWHNSCSSWPSMNYNEQVSDEKPEEGRMCRECTKWDEIEAKRQERAPEQQNTYTREDKFKV